MAGGKIKITAKIQNRDKPKRYLDKAKKCLDDQNFDKALKAGAKVFEEGMQGRAPVDTRTLKKSIKARKNGQKSYKIGPGEKLIPIYAAPQEYGAKGNPYMVFKTKAGWRKVRSIKPTPYVRPTWEQDRDKAYQAFKEQLFKGWPD